MARRIIEDTNLSSLADTIRAKGGTTSQLVFPEQFITAVNNIQTLNDAEITASSPSISVSSSGLITSTGSALVNGVEVDNASNTKQLTTKGATTITPSSSVQTAVSAGTYCTGDIKVGAVSGGYRTGSITPTYDSSAESLTFTVPASSSYTNIIVKLYGIRTGTMGSTNTYAMVYDSVSPSNLVYSTTLSSLSLTATKSGSNVVLLFTVGGGNSFSNPSKATWTYYVFMS